MTEREESIARIVELLAMPPEVIQLAEEYRLPRTITVHQLRHFLRGLLVETQEELRELKKRPRGAPKKEVPKDAIRAAIVSAMHRDMLARGWAPKTKIEMVRMVKFLDELGVEQGKIEKRTRLFAPSETRLQQSVSQGLAWLRKSDPGWGDLLDRMSW
ncbi:hypothetical protein [Histidinibacterium aquaticum]|uniref:Uncharacterized protein n=1 Tax=Histidinibacterium aquaticum TaxID=2613962 RepID=A0A5J5GRK8_9RHOB|nr:hypothetical protein [Histidinibacterium aquaticum]KAA9010174.1 hypothetical protein F3S47_02680 [Histidinibacterium aquaticum]